MKTIYSIYLVLVLLFCFCLLAHSICDLNPYMVQYDDHVHFVQDQLLRWDYVDDNYPLYWACKTEALSMRSTCSRGSFTSVPGGKCNLNRSTNSILPSVLKPIGATDDCPNPAILYAVGFVSQQSGEFRELYKACFLNEELSSKYTVHSIYRNRNETVRGDFTWTVGDRMTLRDAAWYLASSVYRRFNDLLGPNQTFVTNVKNCIIHRGHLAPSADFYYMEHKRASFKYINATPQFCYINLNNWKFIEEYIRKFYEPQKNIEVKTIASGVLKLPHGTRVGEMVSMYLHPGGKIPIPEWTIKILDDYFVFATYNIPLQSYSTLPTSKPCSATTECPYIPNVEYENFSKGYTICCYKYNYVPLP